MNLFSDEHYTYLMYIHPELNKFNSTQFQHKIFSHKSSPPATLPE